MTGPDELGMCRKCLKLNRRLSNFTSLTFILVKGRREYFNLREDDDRLGHRWTRVTRDDRSGRSGGSHTGMLW